jgi:hypothetical protein
MAMRFSLRFLPLGLVSLALLMVVRGAQAASCCPGDVNNDGVVTIDEILRVVNAALNGCASEPVPCQGGGLLTTGQTQCDQGSGTLGACPGSPAGQDGSVLKGAVRNYTDNGDGTITNNTTGLMWEKLSSDGSIHDYRTTYTWYTAFTAKIATLNSGGGFAGHTDWRLPNVNELQSIANYGAFHPAVDAVFSTSCPANCTVTTCSCTQSWYYWSSTTYQNSPTYAWLLSFADGVVVEYFKSISFYVRAVRGGL